MKYQTNLLLSVLVFVQFFIAGCYELEEPSKINRIVDKHKHKDICTKRLNIFSDCHKNFIQCAVEHGQPITMCERCLNKFVNSSIYYQQLTGPHDGINCYEHFVDQDRLNLVMSIYNDGINIWNRASCKDCYDWRDNTMNLNISMETQNVLNHLNNTQTCINENLENGDVCAYCSGQYLILNDLFISMEKRKKSKICFDLQDVMNKTRLRWSKELKCCEERESSLVNFTVLASGFSACILLFYIAVPYFEIKQRARSIPRNQANEEVSNSGTSNDSNNENSNIITGFVRPSSSNKLIKLADDDSSDDDNIIEEKPGPSSKN